MIVVSLPMDMVVAGKLLGRSHAQGAAHCPPDSHADSRAEIEECRHHGGRRLLQEQLGKRDIDGIERRSQKGKERGQVILFHHISPSTLQIIPFDTENPYRRRILEIQGGTKMDYRILIAEDDSRLREVLC